jgi:hypothetical protein
MKNKFIILPGFLFLFMEFSLGQYNACAAKNAISETVEIHVVDDKTGREFIKQEQKKVRSDGFGNADGNQYDLAVDGAFEGQTIVVIQLYTTGTFDFELPKAALKEKGFSVYRYSKQVPGVAELKKALKKACQLWLISSDKQLLTKEHLAVIKEFWDKGHGIYIWGDNSPFHADADFLAKELMGVSMSGDFIGNTVVGVKSDEKKSGLLANHLITTGLEYVYEGITISAIHDENNMLSPLIWSSDGNAVAAVYEREGKRLILDGGFTRLYNNWDTAGTGRYVKNAAAWLVNYEFFGETVVVNKEAN